MTTTNNQSQVPTPSQLLIPLANWWEHWTEGMTSGKLAEKLSWGNPERASGASEKGG
jgi:hypothetical protein